MGNLYYNRIMSMKKKKILLIEDEPLLIELYTCKLKELGIEVLATKSAEEAEEILKKEKIDLIILDILLPKTDGLSFLAKIRERGDESKVVILSNLDDPRLKERAKNFQVKEYLIKANLTPKEIIEKIKKYL